VPLSRGIRIDKFHAYEVIKILNQYNIIDRNYKIHNIDDYVIIPLIAEAIIDQFPQLDFLDDEFNFEEYSKKPDSIKAILKDKIPEDELNKLTLPTSFDQIGNLVVIDLKEHLYPYKQIIGAAIMELQPSTTSVFGKTAKVGGPFRIRQLELISGQNNSTTIHREYGLKIYLDIRKVYFSPRLSTEHKRICKLVKENSLILDMFAGAGSFALHITNQKITSVISIDINPFAKVCFEESQRLNVLQGYNEFIVADARDQIYKFLQNGQKFNYIIMNHPSGAIDYLVDAYKLLEERGTLFLYYFANEENMLDNCNQLISDRIEGSITKIHKVRRYSPEQFHICIEITK